MPASPPAQSWDEHWTVGEINYWIGQFTRALTFDFESDDLTNTCHKLYDQAIKALRADTWAWRNFPDTGRGERTVGRHTSSHRIFIEEMFRVWQRSGGRDGGRNRFILAVTILHEAEHHAGVSEQDAYHPIRSPDEHPRECADRWWS